MTADTEALRERFELWLAENGWTDLQREKMGSGAYWRVDLEWMQKAYQAGHAAAKAETAAAVAAERERAATVVDEKIGAVRKANPGSDGGINSAVGFVLYALGRCADAIRAGAKETSDADQRRGVSN